MIYCLDTNICIYALKGLYGISAKVLSCSPKSIKIPAIVKAELLVGAMKSKYPEKTLKTIQQFLFPMEVIPFDNAAAEKYAEIRSTLEIKGQVIGPNDLIIAATVLANNWTLVTNNEKEFQRINGLNIINWVK